MMQVVYGPDWIHSLIPSVLTYVMALVLPRAMFPRAAFFVVMGYLFAAHLYRMYVAYMAFEFDFTGTQMVLTMKLTSFAYNLFDGTYDAARVERGVADADKRKQRVYQARKSFAISSLPTPLEFFGYMYAPTCILAGPAFEFTDYLASINDTAFAVGGKPRPAPARLGACLLRLAVSIVALVGNMVISANFPMSRTHDPAFIAQEGYILRLGYLMLALFGDRVKYYFAWKIAESASIAGGFGFEGYDASGKPKGWAGVENVAIVDFETSGCVSALSRAWNKRTQGWLERYTYHRTGQSLSMTYLVSAAWHGFYPGYYLFFLSLPLVTEVERILRARVNPLFLRPSYNTRRAMYDQPTTPGALEILYVCVCSWLTVLTVNFLVPGFIILSAVATLRLWISFGFIFHVLLVAGFIFASVLPKPRKAPKDAPSAKAKQQ